MSDRDPHSNHKRLVSADEWRIANNPTAARAAVLARDHCLCASCDEKRGKWHVDHIVPLWSIIHRRDEPESLAYWLIDNLQTLCDACDTIKTRREAAERAKADRIAARGHGMKKRMSKREKVIARLRARSPV